MHYKKTTGLIEYLVFNNVKYIYLCGIAYDYCVLETGIQLQKSEQFKNITVYKNATVAINQDLEPIDNEYKKHGSSNSFDY